MCFMSSPSPAPMEVPPLPPAPAPPPTVVDPAVKAAGAKNRQLAALAGGRDSTLITGGLTDPASTAKKQVLGT
jgi:hypothetical protein